MNALRDAALDYAARGWPVLPLHSWDGSCCTCGHADCASPAKHPRTAHGLKEASTDAEVIRAWWHHWPDANVGVRTGVKFDALDVDGPNALERLTRHLLSPDNKETVDGPTVVTGGGWQVYVSPTGLGNRTRFVAGCDWRGRDGYVVAPPSLHASGRQYEWLVWDMTEPIRQAPSWLLALLNKPPPAPPAAGWHSGSSYGRRALESECGRVALATVGTRNDQLNRSAHALGQLIAAGHLGVAEVGDALLTAATRAGLGESEAEKTIRSGLRAGMRQPRKIA